MFSQGKLPSIHLAGGGLELGLRQVAHGGDHLALLRADVEVHFDVRPAECGDASVGAEGKGGQSVRWAMAAAPSSTLKASFRVTCDA